MRAIVLGIATVCAASPVIGQAGAARAPRVLEIKHYVRGCHVFAKNERPSVKLTLRKGDRIQLVDHDVMDFDIRQAAGPRVGLGDPRIRRSEVRTLAFRRAGLYRFEARNVQTSGELGLQTLGPDNTLQIVVRVG